MGFKRLWHHIRDNRTSIRRKIGWLFLFSPLIITLILAVKDEGFIFLFKLFLAIAGGLLFLFTFLFLTM